MYSFIKLLTKKPKGYVILGGKSLHRSWGIRIRETGDGGVLYTGWLHGKQLANIRYGEGNGAGERESNQEATKLRGPDVILGLYKSGRVYFTGHETSDGRVAAHVLRPRQDVIISSIRR